MRVVYAIIGLAISLVIASCGRTASVSTIEVVPEPVFCVQKEGAYTLKRNLTVNMQNMGQNSPTAKYIMKALRHARLHPSLVASGSKCDIAFEVCNTENPELGTEGYIIEVKSSGIKLTANTEQGLFYAYQTFIQMLPADVTQVAYRAVTIPECTVLDRPRFEWRGVHLDVSRHFFPTKFLKRYIDVMANYKMNRFHLHLTDDHGWRLPSDKYPRLNTVGSWRVDRDNYPWGQAPPAEEGERATYGGYYTREELTDLVNYASARGVEIIPEIDLPGHASALLAAYPQYSCDGGHYDVAIGPYWPPKATLCIGNDSTLQMIEGLLDELIDIFPSKYIHVGGDEVLADSWANCPKCQRRMHNEHLKEPNELEGWLMRHIETYLNEHDRTMIGWDEIADHPIGHNTIIMAWRDLQTGMVAARNGNPVIMCPKDNCYLDYYQASPRHQPPAIGGLITLATAYQFDPVPVGTNSHVAANIIGGQCNLWTEYINTPQHAEYMLLPRMLAISESLWSPRESKDWGRFRRKIEVQKDRLNAKGYHYCEGSFTPKFEAHRINNDTTNIAIETEVPNTYIFYTTDMTTPTKHSSIYIGPINLARGTHIKILPVYRGIERDSVYEFIIK